MSDKRRNNFSFRRGTQRDIERVVALGLHPFGNSIRFARTVDSVRVMSPSRAAEWKRIHRDMYRYVPEVYPVRYRLERELGDPANCRIIPPGMGVGVELEYVRKVEGVTVRGGSFVDMPRLHLPGVEWGWDGSVRILPGHEMKYYQPQTNEVRLFLRFGQWRRLREVCDHIFAQGGRAYPSAGLHVHLDCRDCSEAEARVRWSRLDVAVRSWAYRLCPDYRTRTNYARLMTSRRAGNRYVAVNWESYLEHKTVEVRYHHGTLNVEKITRWVELLRWISRQDRPVRTMGQFLASDTATPELKIWALYRLVRSQDHADVSKSKVLLSSLLSGDEESEEPLTPMQAMVLGEIRPRVRHE